MTDLGVGRMKLKFHNGHCSYSFRKKAEVCILESENNPGRLFFCYVNNKCGFFEWWRSARLEIFCDIRENQYAMEFLLKQLNKAANTCNAISSEVQ